MQIDILYFARMREAMGRDRERLEVPATVRTLAELRDWLCARGEPWAGSFSRVRGLRTALDQRLAREDALLHDGAEVAFFPPVTGG